MTAADDVVLTAQEMTEIEALCAAATPGPWQVLSQAEVACAWLNAATSADDFAIALFDYRTLDENRANAEFAAAARQAMPRLVAEINNLRQRVQQLLEANSKEVDRRTNAVRERDEALAKLARLEGGKE